MNDAHSFGNTDNIVPDTEGLKNALSLFGDTMTEIVKNVDITNGLSTIVQDFTNSLRSAILESFPQPFFKSFRQDLVDSLIRECEVAGSMGWCFHGIDGLGDELSVLFFRQMKRDIDDGKITLESVDSYIAKQFTKEIISDVSVKTEEMLSKEDKEKFQKAMIDFRARRYYDTANILVGLIDAQSIKEILLHGNSGDNISQGWQAFAVAYNNKFSNQFDTSLIKPKSKKRENDFSAFVEANKESISCEIIKKNFLLCYSLLSLFHNSDWHDYPNQKPNVINRNWLAHGMYDYNDIKKSDCLKLMFMLNQVANLYQ